jgi:hypothetical protein
MGWKESRAGLRRQVLGNLRPGSKKSGPIAGATISKEASGKESGKAMQGAGPSHGAAQSEMSKTESEGHSSAASFIDSAKEHLPGQNEGYRGVWAANPQLIVPRSLSGLVEKLAPRRQGRSKAIKCRLLHIRCRAEIQNYCSYELPATVRSFPGRKW